MKKKFAALMLAAAGVLPILGCLPFGGFGLDVIADLITIIDHFEGQF